MPGCYIDLVSNILTPLGFAVVSSVVELVTEDEAEFVAEDDSGAEYNYGQSGFSGEQEAIRWFGEAILRPDPEPFLAGVTLTNAKGEVVHLGEHVKDQHTDRAAVEGDAEHRAARRKNVAKKVKSTGKQKHRKNEE